MNRVPMITDHQSCTRPAAEPPSTAAGRASVTNRTQEAQPMSGYSVPRGPGLFEIVRPAGERAVTNVRRIAGTDRGPGSALIGWAAWLLAALGAGLLFVSFSGQFKYIFLARHQDVPSLIESAMFDVGMIIFCLLALGLARAGKPARTERTLIMACSSGSAAMNYAAADTASPRSVVAYVAAPVFLSVVVDRVVAVIRRHVLGGDEVSAWTALGRATLTAVRIAALLLLYALRFVLAPPSTAKGLRRQVLILAALPQEPAALQPTPDDDQGDEDEDEEDEDSEDTGGGDEDPGDDPEPPAAASKKARFRWHYLRHPDYGDRAKASRVAAVLAPKVGLSPGTARAYAYQILSEAS
jgi:hypothetical protein